MTLEIEIINLVIQLIFLILLFITSIAAIKYIFDSWKIDRLAKKIEKFTKKEIDRNVFDETIQKLSQKRGFREDAKKVIEGTDNNLENLARKFDDLKWGLDNINDTLKRFENYKKREYPTDISQNASKEDI